MVRPADSSFSSRASRRSSSPKPPTRAARRHDGADRPRHQAAAREARSRSFAPRRDAHGRRLYNEVARGRLGPADLSREQHRIVLAAIARVAERSEQVGFANVQSDLVAHDELDAIGGAQFLVGLMQNVPTVAHASSYAAIVEL